VDTQELAKLIKSTDAEDLKSDILDLLSEMSFYEYLSTYSTFMYLIQKKLDKVKTAGYNCSQG
jgi:hypothetical protein